MKLLKSPSDTLLLLMVVLLSTCNSLLSSVQFFGTSTLKITFVNYKIQIPMGWNCLHLASLVIVKVFNTTSFIC